MSSCEQDAVINARGLRKSYVTGEVVFDALRGVDMTVAAGEIVAVMGPSGCGKSTLLHLLGGLARPGDGALSVAGLDLVAASNAQVVQHRRTCIGFVFQRFNLLPSMTVEGNLRIALRIQGDGHSTSSKIRQVLDLVGISAKRRRRPAQLSQGEQQRVAIARAIIGEPSVILADEPTGNLDSANSETVLGEMCRLCDKLGVAVVMATHNPNVALVADRCCRMRDGRMEDEALDADVGH